MIRLLDQQNVLVTGATGSFGRAFIPAAIEHGAHHVVAYSRDELKMWELECKYREFPHLRTYIGDVRDLERLEQAMREHGISDYHQVAIGVLEVDGSMSFLKYDDISPTASSHLARRKGIQKKQ